ncbi:MAG: DUF4910 domain-containing protein, partial [Oscillospiraceae bacterium]
MKKPWKRILCLGLSIVMTLSLAVIPASAAERGKSLDQVVQTMSKKIDGEKAFDYLSYVFMGWRTTGGPWQNYLINDYIVKNMQKAGYVLKDKDVSSDKTNKDDFVYVQHDKSTGYAWAPEYARLELQSAAKGTEPLSADAMKALKKTVDVESYSYDPTCAVYQEHFNKEFKLGLKPGYTTEEFTAAMSGFLTKKENGRRVNVFPEKAVAPGDAALDHLGPEAVLNKRAHLATNASFNVTPEELTAIKAEPAKVRDLAKGKTGTIIYVGNVKADAAKKGQYLSDYQGDAAALKGAILLCDSSNRNNFPYALQVGAVSVMTTASLSEYSNPTVDGKEWYTNSARFAGGAGAAKNVAAMDAGTPVVEWNISHDQYDAIKAQMDAGVTLTANCATVGTMYPMSGTDPRAQGQLTVMAEIKGSKYPDQRVVIAAHVQEPGCDDNATGVALNIELATKMIQMVKDGTIARPERTISFLWGDEMAFSKLWLDAHPEEAKNVVCSIDLDMVGEDPAKTGRSMRIEKSPDPSAYYNYTLDLLPGEKLNYDEKTRADGDGNFVRLPDSHTLWGAGDPESSDIGGNYLNDLYMAATQSLIKNVDKNFEVDVCPYEGGSDHTKFLQAGIPAVLTWHMTDYVYHTTVDTLFMASAKELQNVGIISMATGYFTANANEQSTTEVMNILLAAAEKRLLTTEKANTEAHLGAYLTAEKVNPAAELANELEVLTAWGNWYKEAARSCQRYFDGTFAGYAKLEADAIAKVDKMTADAVNCALELGKKAGVTATVSGDAATGKLTTLTDKNGGEIFVVSLPWDEESAVVTLPVAGATVATQLDGSVFQSSIAGEAGVKVYTTMDVILKADKVTPSFADVKAGDWFYDGAMFGGTHQLFVGDQNHNF